jgi:hypothetical protein
MCKILVVTNTKKVNSLQRLVETSAKLLKTQRDGFGWLAQKPDFSFFGERTNEVENFKTFLDGAKPLNMPFVEQFQNMIGEPGEHQAFIAHGRISTNNKALLNVHPIVRGEWGLIHNGVVKHDTARYEGNIMVDHGAPYKMTTTNDSEHVLYHLQTGGIEQVSAELTGYYAFAAFDPSGVLHVARDKEADLYCAYVEDIESYVYGTTKEIVKELCSDMYWHKRSAIAKLLNNVYVQHLPNGEIMYKHFESRGRDDYSSRLARFSLGREMDSGQTSFTENDYDQPGMYWDNNLKEYVYYNRAAEEARLARQKREKAEAKDKAREIVQKVLGSSSSATKKKGDTWSEKERVQAIKDLKAECKSSNEVWSLDRFFKFIRAKKSKYFVMLNYGEEMPREQFLSLHPEFQLQYDVFTPEGHAIDPFNWNDSIIIKRKGPVFAKEPAQETKEPTSAAMVADFQKRVQTELDRIESKEGTKPEAAPVCSIA